MINIHRSFVRTLMVKILTLVFLMPGLLTAAGPPKELSRVIDYFLSMEKTSLRIDQVIDWRFNSNNDSLFVDMDILKEGTFRVGLALFGMEIFVDDGAMMSVNHVRKQIVYEDASPRALLDQIFVGGNLDDARLKQEKTLDDGSQELKFLFSDDFSDWESLEITTTALNRPNKMRLVDYDGNKYKLSFEYKPVYQDFTIPDIKTRYAHYQVADLRSRR